MKPRTVWLYVFDTLSDWEAGYAIAGINNPQFQLHPGRYRIRTASLRPGPVVTMGGVRIEPDTQIDSITPENSAMLILPGGITWDSGENMEAVDVARTFLGSGAPVAAICGATSGLARGGLLDRRRHTSNSREYLAATQYGGTDLYVDEPAVTDDNVITASGIAPVDFALHIFRRLALYSPQVLETWYGLFKTGKSEYLDSIVETGRG